MEGLDGFWLPANGILCAASIRLCFECDVRFGVTGQRTYTVLHAVGTD